MIILIGSEKGGVGKSTLAMNLSALLTSQKKDVVLVDADRQGTSSIWVQDRLTTDKPTIDCVRLFDNISKTLNSLKSRYENIVVDCQGRDSTELRSGLIVSDIAIFPFRPSQIDLYTLPKIVEMLTQAQMVNPSLVGYALLTMCPTNPQINELENAIEFIQNYPQIKLLKSVISDRKVYRDASGCGLSVIEMDNDKATQEINAFWEEVKNGI